MSDFEFVINQLYSFSDHSKTEERKIKYAINSVNSIGCTQKQINEIVKSIKKSKVLAIELYNTNIYEAQIVCAKIFPPNELTKEEANFFVSNLQNWEDCDTFSLKLFSKCKEVLNWIHDWAKLKNEIPKRAAFATIAGIIMKNKNKPFDFYHPMLNLCFEHINDEREYVKKSISWALRTAAKSNLELKQYLINYFEHNTMTTKSARWIFKTFNDEIKKI